VLRRVCSGTKAPKAFLESWPFYQEVLEKRLLSGSKTGSATASKVWDLGEHLREAFTAAPEKRQGVDESDSQSGLSNAGKAFESLLVWYLNLLLWGTEALVTKNIMELVPNTIRCCTTVKTGTEKSNSETDLIAYSVPGATGAGSGGSLKLAQVNELIRANFADTEVAILQAKTNWNDNAQIPMLWNWIYNDPNPVGGAWVVGIDGFSPLGLKRFSYGFATVPTGKDSLTGAEPGPRGTKMHVKRVARLSGGNYWCAKDKAGIAQCINQFPANNLRAAIALTKSRHLQGHVESNLAMNPTLVDSFLNLDF
jgi:hypothetical protein